MGNHAKRRILAALVKERGLGRLYLGDKRRAWKWLPAWQLDRMIRYLGFRPGDLVNDCDVFNHVIKSYLPSRHRAEEGRVLEIDQYTFEDGRWSCGCPSGVESPKSREDIEAFLLAYASDEELIKNGWITDEHRTNAEKLRRGEHVVDERGMKIVES